MTAVRSVKTMLVTKTESSFGKRGGVLGGHNAAGDSEAGPGPERHLFL